MSKTISANEAKNRLGTWIALVNEDDTEVIIERHGKPKAVIMSFESYEEVEKLREKQRREELLRRLRALREEVRAQNQDLTQEEAEGLANRISRDMIDHMAETGRVSFERDRRQQQ
jgi:prevent-host-death family protein